MKTLFYAVAFTATLFVGVLCRAQKVYSLNGVPVDAFLPAQHRPDEIKIWACGYGSGAQGSQVEWYVSTNALAKQPRWDGLSAEVPLSARRACTLALPHVRERLPLIHSWSVQSVVLRKPYLGERDVFPDVWWYEIVFVPRTPEERARADYIASFGAATQIVLLDGTVVPQTVLKRK